MTDTNAADRVAALRYAVKCATETDSTVALVPVSMARAAAADIERLESVAHNLGRNAWPETPDAEWLRKLACDVFSDHHRQHDTYNRLLQIAERLSKCVDCDKPRVFGLIRCEEHAASHDRVFQLPAGPLKLDTEAEQISALIDRVNARMPSSVTPSTRIEIHPADWLTLVDEIECLQRELAILWQDAERLDYLDALNRKANERNRSRYGWQISINHNRVALTDNNHPQLTVREAIDAHKTGVSPYDLVARRTAVMKEVSP